MRGEDAEVMVIPLWSSVFSIFAAQLKKKHTIIISAPQMGFR
jgi:hypothetical protein